MDEQRSTSGLQRPISGERPEKGVQPTGDGTGDQTDSPQARPSAQQIADRVYELLCQDLRLERERRGR